MRRQNTCTHPQTPHRYGVCSTSRMYSLKAHTGFEPVSHAKGDGEVEVVERPALNPFLARVLERVKQSERDRAT